MTNQDRYETLQAELRKLDEQIGKLNESMWQNRHMLSGNAYETATMIPLMAKRKAIANAAAEVKKAVDLEEGIESSRRKEELRPQHDQLKRELAAAVEGVIMLCQKETALARATDAFSRSTKLAQECRSYLEFTRLSSGR